MIHKSTNSDYLNIFRPIARYLVFSSHVLDDFNELSVDERRKIDLLQKESRFTRQQKTFHRTHQEKINIPNRIVDLVLIGSTRSG